MRHLSIVTRPTLRLTRITCVTLCISIIIGGCRDATAADGIEQWKREIRRKILDAKTVTPNDRDTLTRHLNPEGLPHNLGSAEIDKDGLKGIDSYEKFLKYFQERTGHSWHETAQRIATAAETLKDATGSAQLPDPTPLLQQLDQAASALSNSKVSQDIPPIRKLLEEFQVNALAARTAFDSLSSTLKPFVDATATVQRRIESLRGKAAQEVRQTLQSIAETELPAFLQSIEHVGKNANITRDAERLRKVTTDARNTWKQANDLLDGILKHPAIPKPVKDAVEKLRKDADEFFKAAEKAVGAVSMLAEAAPWIAKAFAVHPILGVLACIALLFAFIFAGGPGGGTKGNETESASDPVQQAESVNGTPPQSAGSQQSHEHHAQGMPADLQTNAKPPPGAQKSHIRPLSHDNGTVFVSTYRLDARTGFILTIRTPSGPPHSRSLELNRDAHAVITEASELRLVSVQHSHERLDFPIILTFDGFADGHARKVEWKSESAVSIY